MLAIITTALVFFAATASASGWGHNQHHDGSWKGEGLAESQWHGEGHHAGQYNGQGLGHTGQWLGEGHHAGQWQGQGQHAGQWHGNSGLHKYGPAPLGHDGRVVDTPEVAHAKAALLAAQQGHGYAGHGAAGYGGYGQAAGGYGGGYGGHGKYHGPAAHIELTHDGKFIKDTPEVAHAKAQHLAALAAASHGHGHHGGYGHGQW